MAACSRKTEHLLSHVHMWVRQQGSLEPSNLLQQRFQLHGKSTCDSQPAARAHDARDSGDTRAHMYLHVSEFCDGLFLVLFLCRLLRVQLHHFFVQILPQNWILDLGFHESSGVSDTNNKMSNSTRKNFYVNERNLRHSTNNFLFASALR